MSLPTIVIVENRGRDSVPLFDFPLKHGPSGKKRLRRRNPAATAATAAAITVTEITDIEDTEYGEESEIGLSGTGLPPGCLPKGHEQSIDLSQRHLHSFPLKVFAICKHLTFLFLQENQLDALPDELFTTFPLLRRLDVRKNKLTCIPSNIGDHHSLEVLLLQDNQISTLPPHLGYCRTLRNLQLQGNPLKWPQENIVKQGTGALLAYLREHDKTNDSLKDDTISDQGPVERDLLAVSRNSEGKDFQNKSEKSFSSRTSHALTKYAGINFKGGGESKMSHTRGPRNTPTKANSKTSQRTSRKSSASFDAEDQATLICRRGQFPLGYQKRMSYVPPNQVYESLRRELWKDILRRELVLQDYLLQKRRDSDTLRDWRQKTRYMQLLPKGNRKATMIPFDYDDNLRMMTWRELLQARCQSLEHKGHSKPGPLARRAPDPSEGILKLLQEIDKLKEDGNRMSGLSDEASQYQYQVNLSTQITKLRELQKTLRSIRIL